MRLVALAAAVLLVVASVASGAPRAPASVPQPAPQQGWVVVMSIILFWTYFVVSVGIWAGLTARDAACAADGGALDALTAPAGVSACCPPPEVRDILTATLPGERWCATA